jgi:hypothetical protein
MADSDKFEQGIRWKIKLNSSETFTKSIQLKTKILNDSEVQDLNLKIYLTNFLNLNLF